MSEFLLPPLGWGLIQNSIRQGGVPAVTQYATLIDEISKEIEDKKNTRKLNKRQKSNGAPMDR